MQVVLKFMTAALTVVSAAGQTVCATFTSTGLPIPVWAVSASDCGKHYTT